MAEQAMHSPEARRKAQETMAKNRAMKINALSKAQKASQSPEVRKKAVATLRKTLASKKAAKAAEEGEVTRFKVSDLPPRPTKVKRIKFGKRRQFTPEQRSRAISIVEAGLKNGKLLKDACKRAKIHESQYREWKRDPSKLANGSRIHTNGSVSETNELSYLRKRMAELLLENELLSARLRNEL